MSRGGLWSFAIDGIWFNFAGILCYNEVTKWEAGQTTPSSDNLIALANLYDVSLDELIGKNTGTLIVNFAKKH